MTSLRVAEVFGPTAQGEGPHIGHVSAFVRLSGCNLSCSWCDTPYTWDWSRFDEQAEAHDEDGEQLARRLTALGVERVVLTGGEPLVQQRRLGPFLHTLALHELPVDVETNGTIVPTPDVVELVDLFVVSPKIGPSAGQLDRSLVLRDVTMAQWRERVPAGKVAWKYVARDTTDLDAIGEHVLRHELTPVYVMPEARTVPELVERTAALADAIVARGWRLSTRLHVLAWGDERGR